MEDKIFDIVTDLIRDDISKDEAIDKLLILYNVRLSLPTDEEIKQKAFDFSYVFRDDEDCKRSDAVETYCEEMGYWMKNKIQSNEA